MALSSYLPCWLPGVALVDASGVLLGVWLYVYLVRPKVCHRNTILPQEIAGSKGPEKARRSLFEDTDPETLLRTEVAAMVRLAALPECVGLVRSWLEKGGQDAKDRWCHALDGSCVAAIDAHREGRRLLRDIVLERRPSAFRVAALLLGGADADWWRLALRSHRAFAPLTLLINVNDGYRGLCEWFDRCPVAGSAVLLRPAYVDYLHVLCRTREGDAVVARAVLAAPSQQLCDLVAALDALPGAKIFLPAESLLVAAVLVRSRRLLQENDRCDTVVKIFKFMPPEAICRLLRYRWVTLRPQRCAVVLEHALWRCDDAIAAVAAVALVCERGTTRAVMRWLHGSASRAGAFLREVAVARCPWNICRCDFGGFVVCKAIALAPYPCARVLYAALRPCLDKVITSCLGARVVCRLIEQPDRELREAVVRYFVADSSLRAVVARFEKTCAGRSIVGCADDAAISSLGELLGSNGAEVIKRRESRELLASLWVRSLLFARAFNEARLLREAGPSVSSHGE